MQWQTHVRRHDQHAQVDSAIGLWLYQALNGALKFDDAPGGRIAFS